jgi:hypothetical protein
MSESLVATDEADPLDVTEGAGIWSSVADVVGAARPLTTGEQFSPAEFGAAGVGLALDALGAAQDPIGQLVLEPAVGWLIEHIAFIREPYDKLAGDPGQITLNAETWHNVAGRLTEVADGHERAVTGPIGWRGEACEAYRSAASTQVAALRRTAAEAEGLADEVLRNGALVGTVRSLIRDLIAELVARLLTWLAGVLATAAVTGGATLAGYVPVVVAEALSTLKKIMGFVRELLGELARAAKRLADLASRSEVGLPAAVRKALDEAGPAVRETVEEVRSRSQDIAVEGSKQGTTSEREQANWGAPAGPDGWVPVLAPGTIRRYGVIGMPPGTGGDRHAG